MRHSLLSFALLALATGCVASAPPPEEPAPAAEAPPPAEATPAEAPPARAMEPGVNRNGSDIENMDLSSADPALCAAECDRNEKCLAWTYVKPGVQGPNARCWLKSPVPDGHADDCCTSGVK